VRGKFYARPSQWQRVKGKIRQLNENLEALLKLLAIFLLSLTLSACSSGAEVDFARSLAVKAPAEIVLRGGKIITVDSDFSVAEAVAIRQGRFVAVGTERDIRPLIASSTKVIDLAGRTVIPGLIDSHIHATVAGLSWDHELHWESLRTLADGLRQIAIAAKANPPGSWIVVGGGWVPTQFAERRFPSRAELDALAPNHPVYIQYLRQGALLNRTALAAVGIAPGTPDPAGGKFERNPNTGELTGWLQGVPAWEYAYEKIPQLPLDKVRQSLRDCFLELNRLGVTSVGDLQTDGVGFAQRRLLGEMARSGELSLRVDFYVAANDSGDDLEQFKVVTEALKRLPRSDLFRFAGFVAPLFPGIDVSADSQGTPIDPAAMERFRWAARFFAEGGYNFHLPATEDNHARQLLGILEQVQQTTPFTRQRITFAGLEDATPETIARIKRLGGAITVVDPMALTGERYAELWGLDKARNAPPLRTLVDSSIPLGAGTDAFQSANYSPMLALWWMITGKTVAGTELRSPSQRLTRADALRLYTTGGAWLTYQEGRKGSIEPGKFADLVVLNADYLTVPEDQIRTLESLLTMVGGRIVHAARPFTLLEQKK
jgi:predicted amidohydrolase YtcJ